MYFEEKILVNASADKIFKIYEKVSEWPLWDPDCKKAELHGKFESGSTGTIYPNGGPKSKLYFTEVIKNKGFKVECKLPLCKMKFDHEIKVLENHVQVIHSVSFTGFLAPLFGKLIGSSLKKTLPTALLGLKKAAEQ